MKTFYLTTAIPYVNAAPHLGHALEFVQADAITRFHKEILGEETLLLSGADENALKNVQAATAAGVPVQDFVDKNAETFEKLARALNVHFDVFQKGTSPQHAVSSQGLWKLCEKNGDIYKKSYEGLYCVGCEAFYSIEELNEKGECLEHPGKTLEKVSEENYFFKLSKYQDQLVKLISSNELHIVPETRKNEMLGFLKQPLQDISISRSNERAKNWGVPVPIGRQAVPNGRQAVPGDDSQRMYVWFDALNIYQSGIGFGWDEGQYKKWWPADVHVIGKGIARFHAIYWPAFLLSAGLSLPKQIFVHGYFTVNGQKMSKTVGNVVDPFGLVEKYGTDAVRYYLLTQIPAYSDGDFSEERFVEVYNADLANGLGNLVSRVAKLCETNGVSINGREARENRIITEITPFMETFQSDKALEYIWRAISNLDGYINQEKPWEARGSNATEILTNIVLGTDELISLLEIAEALSPFLPETSKKIVDIFGGNKIALPAQSLFPRI